METSDGAGVKFVLDWVFCGACGKLYYLLYQEVDAGRLVCERGNNRVHHRVTIGDSE